MSRFFHLVCMLLFFPFTVQTMFGELTLPAVFSDNMILQRDMLIPFWGMCSSGECISVSIDGREECTVADAKGNWLLRYPAMKTGGPHRVIIAAKKDTVILNNVFIGDVWLASGQSNMEMPIAPNPYFTGVKNYKEEIANAGDSLLRMFTVKKKSVVEKPQTQLSGQWLESNSSNVGGFSAVAYFFGKNLRENIPVPIGIIHTSWGASPAQAWTSMETLLGDASLRKLVDDWKKIDDDYLLKIKEFERDSISWAEHMQQSGITKEVYENKYTKRPRYPIYLQKRPGSLYNGMLYPLIPYAIKGVIWYQAEGNEKDPDLYKKLFPAMITNWRDDWGEGNFPFLFVQVAGNKKRQTEPSEGGWAYLREAQVEALRLPNTAMVTAMDIGEENDVHPKNKQEVGYRLAQAALSQVYKCKDAFYTGPVFNRMKIKKNKVHLYFKYIDGGLLSMNSDTLKGFAMSGWDKNFVWATATIHNNKVVLYNKSIKKPVAVRYAWANNPIGNLYNEKKMPAMPFRTDCWEDDSVRILTLGDSNGTFSYAWPYQLVKEMPNSVLFNVSRSGKTIGFNNNGEKVLNQLATLDADLEEINEKVGERKIDYIVIGLGTNDAKSDFKDRQDEVFFNLESLIKKIQSCKYESLKSARIIIKSPTPYGIRSQSQPKYIGGDDRVKRMNSVFRKIAMRYNCIFVDTYMPFKKKMDAFSEDGLHLNAEGQSCMARLIIKEIGNHQ